MADDQEDQQVTNVVPNIRFPGRPGELAKRGFHATVAHHGITADPAWGAAYPLVTYWLWRYHGDLDAVRKHYEGIRDWIDYLNFRYQKTCVHHGDS